MFIFHSFSALIYWFTEQFTTLAIELVETIFKKKKPLKYTLKSKQSFEQTNFVTVILNAKS